MQNLTKADFTESVLEAQKPVLLYFSAPWCVPCKAMGPMMERMEAQFPGTTFYKVNVEEEGHLAEDCSVRSVPTVILFDRGTIVAQSVGAAPESKIKGLLGG